MKPPIPVAVEAAATAVDNAMDHLHRMQWGHYQHSDGTLHTVGYCAAPRDFAIREALKATWDWHDRRLALADALDALELGLEPICSQPLWPRILEWPDKLVSYGEAYLHNPDPRPWSDEHEKEGSA